MLSTERLRLQPVQMGDTRFLTNLFASEPGYSPFGRALPPTQEDVRAFLGISSMREDGYVFAIERMDTENPGDPGAEDPDDDLRDAHKIGIAHLVQIDRNQGSARIALLIRRDMRGQGYGAEALEGFISYLWNEQNLRRVWTKVPAGEPWADWLMKRGFEREVVRREALFRGGRYIDEIQLARFNGVMA